MLLLKGNFVWSEYASRPGLTLVILPASADQDSEQVNRIRVHDLALTGRIAEVWVSVLLCSSRHFVVAYRGQESQVVGLARELIRQGKLAENWFLRRREVGEPLFQELPNRGRQLATLTDTGFELCDGRRFQPESLYHPAQNNTSYGHSLGYDVGDHICDRPHCRSLEKFRKRQTAGPLSGSA